ncbi:hypothetical protein DVH05_027146 [Phytophthora capsici]|nr:hypothetical protein DVH05_027146 [Phytophthora capsici]
MTRPVRVHEECFGVVMREQDDGPWWSLLGKHSDLMLWTKLDVDNTMILYLADEENLLVNQGAMQWLSKPCQ